MPGSRYNLILRGVPLGSGRQASSSFGGDVVSFLSVNPDVVAAATTDLANIGAKISDANAAAAAMTTELVPAAEDEISAAIAGLFGTYAQDYHALAAQAAAFRDRFVQALRASAGSYVAAESANVAALFQTAQQNLLGVMNGPAVAAATAVVQISAAGPVPENAYPDVGIKQLTFTQSVSNGLQILDSTLQPLIAAGTPVSVFGYSQSAVVASLEMVKLQAEGVASSAVSFVIVGDPMNPNGGLFERFTGLQLPSLGMIFSGATPSNAYPTTIYTIEYDSFADFPRYPLDFLSDFNVIESNTHFDYHVLSTAQLANAIQLPTSGPTTTTYYAIPITSLPLVAPFRGIPIIGNPFADLLQPDLTYLVNLGYGDPLYGWSTGPANVPTPAGLLPPLSAFEELPGLLVSGTQQGIQNFIGDFTGTGPNPVMLPSLSSLTSLLSPSSLTSLLSPSSLTSLLDPSSGMASGTSAVAGPATGLLALAAGPAVLGAAGPATGLSALAGAPAVLGSAINNIAGAFSLSASDLYAKLLPTADIINAALISVPSYDVDLFLNGILQAVNGQPLTGLANAFGQPIASDIALYLYLTNVEAAVLSSPLESAGPATGVPGLGIG